MNNLIKELSKQAMDYAAQQYGPQRRGEQVWNPDVYDQKFAELIVNNCLSVVKSNIHGPCGKYDYGYTDEDYAADNRAESILRDIKYHFGVRS